MKMVKSLLLGSAAGLVAVAGAQAADMPVKAAPVQFVKICSLYGDAFYYIPGTDTCIKFGGYVRVQAEYNAEAGGIPDGSGAVGAAHARYNRWDTNDVDYRSRGALSVDVRQQTEYGTLRTYFRTGIQVTTPGDGEGGNVFIDRAFIQFAGFTVGKTQSFFDLFTYGGGMSYHNVRTAGDTGAIGTTLWAYTAQFGNGFSGTLSLESPSRNRALAFHPVIDVTNANFFNYGTVAGDTAFAHNNGGNGFRTPDIVANLRVDQAWGFFGVSGALHESSGAYYQTPNSVNNGHPADKYGWAAAVGGQIILANKDQIGANFCYSEGAAGFCTNAQVFGLYDSSSSVALGWISDGIFDTGTQVEHTKVWSINGGYQHFWSPQWRTSLYGGYVDIDYSGGATFLINRHLSNASAVLCTGLPTAGQTFNFIAPALGNSCSPDWSFWSIGTRTQWNPVAQLDIGLDILYTHVNTAYQGPATIQPTSARPGTGPGFGPINTIDDQDVWSFFFRWQRNFFP